MSAYIIVFSLFFKGEHFCNLLFAFLAGKYSVRKDFFHLEDQIPFLKEFFPLKDDLIVKGGKLKIMGNNTTELYSINVYPVKKLKTLLYMVSKCDSTCTTSSTNSSNY